MNQQNNQQTEKEDFTNKGRTNNPGQDKEAGSDGDISRVDQQEGELNHGTTGTDHELFSKEKQPDQPSSQS